MAKAISNGKSARNVENTSGREGKEEKIMKEQCLQAISEDLGFLGNVLEMYEIKKDPGLSLLIPKVLIFNFSAQMKLPVLGNFLPRPNQALYICLILHATLPQA